MIDSLPADSRRGSISLEDQEPIPGERRIVALWCMAYLGLTLAILPFAANPVVQVPAFTGIYATAVFIADMCTFVLLSAQFRAGRSTWLLMLACAYLFSAVMAMLHLSTFPGAVIAGSPLIGPPDTVAWLYIFWTLGFMLLLFVAALWHAGGSRKLHSGASVDKVLMSSVAAVLILTALLYLVAAEQWLPPAVVGNRFSALNNGLNWVRTAVGVATLFIVWRTGRQRTSIVHLWLSLALVAAIVGPVVTSLGSQRYTFGWYAGRLSLAFASAVLLCVLLAEFVRLQNALTRSVDFLEAQSSALQAEIDRRELAERQLLQAQKLEAIGRMAGGVSHDFNNLLGAVLSYLEVIVRTSTEGPVRGLAERAKQVALRGGRLTRSLLAFVQRQPLRAERVSTPDLLNRFEMLMKQAVGDSFRLHISARADTWPVHVDPDQLEIALLNLALNSRDAMPAGGEIRIACDNASDPDISSLSQPGSVLSGEYVAISVSDTGSGIADDDIEKVFDPFFTTKEVGKGTGLGLSQVRGFIRQSGGEVIIRSVKGEWTTVNMYLPRATTVQTAHVGPLEEVVS